MNIPIQGVERFRKAAKHKVVRFFVVTSSLLLVTQHDLAIGAGFKPPEECLAYTGEHFQQCLYAMLEIQAAKVSELQEKVKTQETTIQQLRAQLDERAATAEQLQSQVGQQDQMIQNLHTQAQATPFFYGPPYSPFYGPPYGPWGGGVGVCLFGC